MMRLGAATGLAGGSTRRRRRPAMRIGTIRQYGVLSAGAVAVFLVTLCLAPSAQAQASGMPAPPRGAGVGGVQPPAPLPEIQPGAPAPPLGPPPPAVAPTEDTASLSARLRVAVRRFEFTGNTVIGTEELERVAVPYTGRTISSEELLELRDKLTLHYVERGYISSGAVIPDQDVVDGVIQVRIVEGRLSEIEVTGLDHLDPEYVTRRIDPETEIPLNIQSLQSRLLVLQQSPAIDRLNAELAPSHRPGESVLRVAVTEAAPAFAAIGISNDQPVSTGSTQAWIALGSRNLTGSADSLSFATGATEGAENFNLGYAVPLNRRDTTLGLFYDRTSGSVVEEPFDVLDIESKTVNYGATLTHPLLRTPNRQLSMGLGIYLRTNETKMLGVSFPFVPGAQDGVTDVTVLRFSQEWVGRERDRVIAARSTFSWGLDAGGATKGTQPDGQFFAWLGQFQWIERFGEQGYQAIVRADAQFADQRLLALEQFAIGGVRTVRGYRENQLIRDDALVLSAEVRVPLGEPDTALHTLQLGVFGDYGKGWNRGASRESRYLASVGIALRWLPERNWFGDLQWGYRLKDVPNSSSDLQSRGIHFALGFRIQ
jgi:hemolysin activation/secretion protein